MYGVSDCTYPSQYAAARPGDAQAGKGKQRADEGAKHPGKEFGAESQGEPHGPGI